MGIFLRFLSCANGIKSCKASHILLLISQSFAKKSAISMPEAEIFIRTVADTAVTYHSTEQN